MLNRRLVELVHADDGYKPDRCAKPTRESLIAGLESLSNQSYGEFSVSFSPTDHVASRFVELSMLTGDGRVRT